MSGPFHLAPDLNGRQGKYLLVGAFTWLAPGQGGDDFDDTPIPEIPEGAPEMPMPPKDDQEIADADDVRGELAEERRRKDTRRMKEKLQKEKRASREEKNVRRRSQLKKEKRAKH